MVRSPTVCGVSECDLDNDEAQAYYLLSSHDKKYSLKMEAEGTSETLEHTCQH